MSRTRLLDLFCGAGGAAKGYQRAGFYVVGVDINPQPHYCGDEFYQADALTFPLEGFDAYHTSPPCQGYCKSTKPNSKYVSYSQGSDTPKLISPIRCRLQATSKPYVIENVIDSRWDMILPITLCGVMFGLPIPRHRLFETNFFVPMVAHSKCHGVASRYARENSIDYRDMSITGKGRRAGCKKIWHDLMGITWPMTQAETVEAIPPAYTEHIGGYLMKAIRSTERQEDRRRR